jgi:hypothetical protein
MANRNTKQNSDRKVILAIPKHLSNVGTMNLAGTSYTPSDLVRLFQSRIEAADAATAAHAKWLDTVKGEREQIAQTAIVVRAFKNFLLSMFADQTEPLADFGVSPRKAPKKTVATKAKAVAQTKATRKVRNTMGKQQKKAVKGSVTGPGTTTSTSTGTGTAAASGGATPHAVPSAT